MANIIVPVTFASISEVRAGTVTNKAIPPSLISEMPGIDQAQYWGTVSAGVLTAGGGFGLTSVVRNSAGDFTGTLSAAMASTQYKIIGGVRYTAGGVNTLVMKDGTSLTTTVFQFLTKQFNGTTADPDFFWFRITGGKA